MAKIMEKCDKCGHIQKMKPFDNPCKKCGYDTGTYVVKGSNG